MNGVIAPLKTASLGDALVRRFPPLYRGFRKQLRLFEESDLASRQALQQGLLRHALSDATRSPAYASLIGQEIGAFPILAKEQLRSKPDDHLAGSKFLTVAAATSGSSGVPLSLRRSFSSVVFEQAALDHVVELAGADFSRDRIAVLRGGAIKDPSDMSPPFWRIDGNGRTLQFSVAHLNAKTASAFIDALQAFSPKVLWVYPSALEMLIACFERDGRRMHVPVVLSSSEVLADNVRARAESLFGACVVDYYGQAERVCFAYALEAGAWRFMPAYGRVELHAIDSDDAFRYRLIATNLRNGAQPLIRYDTGDVIVMRNSLDTSGETEVAFGCMPFLRVDGRESDYLVAPDGSRLIGMNHIPRSIPGLLQMQLRQIETDRVVVLVVPDGLPNHTLKAAITTQVRARLPQTMTIEIRFCEAIEREKSGKLPLVMRAPHIGTSDLGASTRVVDRGAVRSSMGVK